MKYTECIREHLWYIHPNKKYEKKNICEFDLAKQSVTSDIITIESYSHKYQGNDYDYLIKKYPNLIDKI
jgi:hypothetical protein